MKPKRELVMIAYRHDGEIRYREADKPLHNTHWERYPAADRYRMVREKKDPMMVQADRLAESVVKSLLDKPEPKAREYLIEINNNFPARIHITTDPATHPGSKLVHVREVLPDDEITRLREQLKIAVEGLEWYAGDTSGKERSHWVEHRFVVEDKFGCASFDDGSSAKHCLTRIAALSPGTQEGKE
jgi:hypothetical protein